jgi:hypothetical protein
MCPMSNQPRIDSLSIDSLDLDTGNPRIRKWIEQYGDNPTFDQMLLALGAGSSDPEGGGTVTFQSLKESIRAHGGITTPIIVQPIANGRFRVIEGNSRVAIFRSFLDGSVPGSWDRIPALIYDDLSPRAVEAIRLQCHIVGARQWDPYSKAKYLNHLLNVENMPLTQVVDLCGGRKREITQYVEAYHDMEKFYRPILESDSDFDPQKFSAFVELQQASVKAAIFEANFTISDFANWVSNRNIDPLNTVRALPRILRHPQAKVKFLAVNAREALKILDVPSSPALTSVPFDQLLLALMERLDKFPYPEVKALQKDPGGNMAQLLLQTKDSLVELCNDIAPE